MVYAQTHTYVTFQFQAYGTLEGGQFGVRCTPETEPVQAQANAILAAANTFWDSAAAGSAIGITHSLTAVKMALIQPNGKYPDGFVPIIASQPPNSGGLSAELPIPQCAFVVTLRGPAERGIASHGRVYLPGLAVDVGATGQYTAATVDNVLSSFRTLLLAINAAVSPGFAAIMSNLPAGRPAVVREITRLEGGLRPDVHRSRGRSIPDTPRRTLAL